MYLILRILKFWILRVPPIQIPTVLDHFIEKSFYRIFLTERPFDRNTIWSNTVWPNTIWPKGHLTESPFNRTPFDRKFILPKVHFTERSYDRFFFRKWSFDRINLCRKYHMTERFYWKWSFDRKFIRPKTFLEKIVIWPKGPNVFFLNGRLTESFFFEKLAFDRLFIFH
jgi:hypothetical protein